MTTPHRKQILSRRLAYSIRRLAKESDVGRSSLYEEISAQRLVARKIGRRTIIRRADAIRWLRSLPLLGRDDHLANPQRLPKANAAVEEAEHLST
jgi:hypothetical protein